MTRPAILLLAALGLGLVADGAVAQTPTEAQQQAIRANCAADYRANCSSIPPGGMDSLVCLEQNQAKLSAGCRSAVDAVKAPAPTTASSPAPPTKPAENSAGAAAKPAAPSSAEPSASAPEASSSATAVAPRKPAAAAPALSFRDELRISARACARDFRRHCPSLPIGHGNAVSCLKLYRDQLTPQCRNALNRAGAAF